MEFKKCTKPSPIQKYSDSLGLDLGPDIGILKKHYRNNRNFHSLLVKIQNNENALGDRELATKLDILLP